MNSSGAEKMDGEKSSSGDSSVSNISDARMPDILVVKARAIIIFHNGRDSAPPFPIRWSHFCPRFKVLTIYTSIMSGHLHRKCGDLRIVPQSIESCMQGRIEDCD